jgi:hypothetical protein
MSQVRKTGVLFNNTRKKNLRVCAQGRQGENPASGLSELPHFGVALGSKNAGAVVGQNNSGAPHARSLVVASAASNQSTKENKTSKLFMEMESTKLELMVCFCGVRVPVRFVRNPENKKLLTLLGH